MDCVHYEADPTRPGKQRPVCKYYVSRGQECNRNVCREVCVLWVAQQLNGKIVEVKDA